MRESVFIREGVLHIHPCMTPLTVFRIAFFVPFAGAWALACALGLYEALAVSGAFLNVALIVVLLLPVLGSVLFLIVANLSGRERVSVEGPELVIVGSLPGFQTRRTVALEDIGHVRIAEPRQFTNDKALQSFGLFKWVRIEHGNRTTRLGRDVSRTDAQIILSYVTDAVETARARGGESGARPWSGAPPLRKFAEGP